MRLPLVYTDYTTKSSGSIFLRVKTNAFAEFLLINVGAQNSVVTNPSITHELVDVITCTLVLSSDTARIASLVVCSAYNTLWQNDRASNIIIIILIGISNSMQSLLEYSVLSKDMNVHQ